MIPPSFAPVAVAVVIIVIIITLQRDVCMQYKNNSANGFRDIVRKRNLSNSE